MDTNRRTKVIAPVARHVIEGARYSAELGFYHGDIPEISRMLAAVTTSPGGRVALAIRDFEVVGFLALLPPLPGDRFHGMDGVVELAADDVADPDHDPDLVGRMLHALAGPELEDLIIYDVVDPGLREDGESARRYRARLTPTLGVLGFVSLPTDYPEAHLRRDAAFMARIGANVSAARADAFLNRLHDRRGRVRRPPRVAIVLRNHDLRNLVRQDLEGQGVPVIAVGTAEDGISIVGADVLVTDVDSLTAPFTVRVVDDDELRWVRDTLYIPLTDLDRLGDILRAGSRWWDRYSSIAS